MTPDPAYWKPFPVQEKDIRIMRYGGSDHIMRQAGGGIQGNGFYLVYRNIAFLVFVSDKIPAAFNGYG